MIQILLLLGVPDLGLLGGMVVLAAAIDVQTSQGVLGDGVLGQHAADGQLHGQRGLGLHQGAVLDFLQAADPTGVVTIVLLIQLLAGQDSLLGIDDDDKIAAVSVGSELGLPLAAQQVRGQSGGLAQGLPGGIQYIPGARDVPLVSHKSGHR